MELDGLARCLAHSRPGNGSPNDFTWKKMERLIHLCPHCQFKSVNKIPAIRQLRTVLDKQKERKPPFDRLYPPQDQLLDIKPETIYHFDELEQQSVLSLCKYLCVSHGQYLHKILPLLLRYLATLHLAKWPPHYFKNLFLMKYQQNQNTEQNPEQNTEQKVSTDSNNINNDIIEEEEEEKDDKDKEDNINNNNNNNNNDKEKEDNNNIDHNLSAIDEEPQKLPNQARQSMIIDGDEDDDNSKQIDDGAPMMNPATSLTASSINGNTKMGTPPIGERTRDSDDENKADEPDETVQSRTDEIEIKYDEDIPDEQQQPSPEEKTKELKEAKPSQNIENDLLKYMDNPLRSPLCQFVMEFIYNIGDISHAVDESAPIIRQAIIIILKEYIKILKEENDDSGGGVGIGGIGGIGDEYDAISSINNQQNNHHTHSFYIVLPIIWGILNAIKEDVSISMDRKCALSISKCVDTLSKYNKTNAIFSTLWKSEWDILSTGVRASLLAYFLPAEGPIEKAPKKLFETKIIKDYFKLSMDIIGVKKSPSSIEVREQHMRLATICAIYERSLREKLEKTIKDILNFHISKYIKSSFNVYKISPSKQKNIKNLQTKTALNHNHNQNRNNNGHNPHNPRTLKYRMRDQTILINACCLVLEQLAERAPHQLQEISYYFQRLLIDRNAIYLQDEEINERLMDALARVCQCELKYMEERDIAQKQLNNLINKRMDNNNNNMDIIEDIEEEKQLFLTDNNQNNNNKEIFDDDNDEEQKYENKYDRHRQSHHKKASSGLLAAFNEQHNKHWYDDSSTRTVFNELENNFNDSVNEDSKLINRALRIYGAMMVKVNHKLITQQFLTSSLKGRLTQKLTVILPYLIDTAINQQSTEIQFVREIVQLLVQSYLTKSSSYQLDTKRKIAEAFTELSSNLTQYNLRQFILTELLKMFTTLSKEILNNHVKKKATLVLASNELGLILPAIAVLCTPLYYVDQQQQQQQYEYDEQQQYEYHDDDQYDDDQYEEEQQPIKQKQKIFKSKKQRIINNKREKLRKKRKERKGDHEDISVTNRNPSYFGTNQYIAEEWGVTLMDNHSYSVTMFREFWSQIIFFDFVASTNNEYKIYLQTIAAVTPVLVSGSSTLFAGGLIHEVLKNKTNSLNINKQIGAMRSKLSNIIKLDNINHLEPDAVLFLNVIYYVELFRVYSGSAYMLSHYLNDSGIQRSDLQHYVESIVDYVFDRYLQHIYQSKASSEKLVSLESHTEYLLAMCCSRSSRIRSKTYNWLQHKLIPTYSYLQWRPKCLQNILDIVSKLETLIDDVSTELYSSNDSHSIITFNNKFSLDLPEDRKSRAEIRSIILDIAGAWLHSAWNLAPSEMISVVAHKLSLYKSPLLSSLMYTQCKFNAHKMDGDNQPNMGLMYVVSKCERYLGVMEGLYRTHLLHHIQKSFGQSKAQLFIQTFKRYIAMQSKIANINKDSVYSNQLEQGMIEEMYQVGALIVWTYNKTRNNTSNNASNHHFKLPLEELLHLLCMVPAIVFKHNIVLCGTFVWRWIMTTSPELQQALIRQMKPAWSFIIEQRKGIFANKHVKPQEIEAHDIWISWFLNGIENIIESSPESVENISVIMIDGLAAISHETQEQQQQNNNNNNNNNNNKMQQQQHHDNNNKAQKISKPRPKVPSQKAPTVKSRFAKQRDRKGSKPPKTTSNNNNNNNIVSVKQNKHHNKDKKEENIDNKEENVDKKHHKFDSYIARFGATLRFFTSVARILNALRSASVPLLSKTIATILRGHLYRGIYELFECKIVWRYPSSWKSVSSNAKAIVELFQFFMTEHRHVIRRHYNTLKHKGIKPQTHHTQQMSFNLSTTSNLREKYVPSPPAINIDNHRSSKLKANKHHNKTATNTSPTTTGTATASSPGNENNMRTRPSLTTTMPYLSQTTDLQQSSNVTSVTKLHRHSHTTLNFRTHRKTQSFHYNQHRTVRGMTLRGRSIISSKTQRSPSIRRNSFGHSKNTSFDLDAIFPDNGDLDTMHHHIGSMNSGGINTLIFSTETNITNIVSSDTNNNIINKNNKNNAYLYKLDADDVYYWEGNNAFIQDTMTNWLHEYRGWCQMVCCVFLSDELERLCAWYNTRDNDNVSSSHNNNSNHTINDISGIDDDDHRLNRIDSGGAASSHSKGKGIDDRISKFLYQEVLIEYISKIGDQQWSILCDTAWSFKPLLAVRFYQRFKYKDFQIQITINSSSSNNNNNYLKTITKTLKQHLHQKPKSIQNIPDAVHLLITDSTVKKDGIELEELCQFTCLPLYKCLPLLTEKNLTHSIVNQYLFRSLRYESFINMEGVIFIIPQLLQALRFDPSGMLREFLIGSAENDLTMAHQLIWLCDCQSYQGEDMHSLQNDNNDDDQDDDDDDFCKEMERLSNDIKDLFKHKPSFLTFYENEFEFFDAINSASVDIEASKYNKKEKKRLIRAALIEIRDCIDKYKLNGSNKLYMPTNPQWEIVDILPDSVIALQSAAKVPFLVDFQVRKYRDDIGHMIQNDMFNDLELPPLVIQKCIFKTHDDCGQDALALQIIEYFRTIFEEAGLPLLLFPYRVIATRSGRDKVIGGMIECVRNARSRSDLGAENNYRLRRYFIETYGDIESKSFRRAQRNFILSLAGYAVVCYLLQIKDRHNANIMINQDGHLIHIDFGFLFDISPGKNIGFETAGFKINDEMVELIGDDGSHTTPLFLWFVELCIRGYLVCREHMDEIIAIIQLSSNSNLPCFLPQTMTNLRNRFVPEMSTTKAAQHMKERVIHACSTWTTNAYDEFQKRSQGIWKAPAKDED